MKFHYIIPILLSFSTLTQAQLNVSLLSNLPSYELSPDTIRLNDIWGYASPDGTEYALVGLENGLSIVSLNNPAEPEVKAFIPGPRSVWRDIKTWDHYAYVTHDFVGVPGTDSGLLVVNLENLPDGFTNNDWHYWKPDVSGLGEIHRAHNLYIDEFGYLYLAGANTNNGGVIYVDVFSDPWNPKVTGWGPNIYSHDVYARNNLLYSSNIQGGNGLSGHFAVYDVSDKQDPLTLAARETPRRFCHNTWLSDDENYLFTTDERSNAPVASYDISDLNNITELDQFRPVETLGDGVIPHNVHVWDSFLIISYYTDGCIIVDATRPENLIEVGNFDTYIPSNTGFSGAWGAYPFFPSGVIIVSDRNSGLYVLEPNYTRACYLEGVITNAQTAQPIIGAEVNIGSGQPNFATSEIGGVYRTGQAIAGTFSVTFSKVGYFPKIVEAILENGEVSVLDIELEPLPSVNVNINTIRDKDGNPIPGALVQLEGEELEYEITTDGQGNFSLSDVVAGNYTILAGRWGYLHEKIENIDILEDKAITITLEEGYQDDFFADFSWDTDNQAATGNWELGQPLFVSSQGVAIQPGNDINGDIGEQCYVTGNSGGFAGQDDVDDGINTLISPPMLLDSLYNDPVLDLSLWYFNGGGSGDPIDDTLKVIASNGQEQVVILTLTGENNSWMAFTDTLSHFLPITNDMRVSVRVSDLSNGHLVEAAVDGFLIAEGMPDVVNSDQNVDSVSLGLSAFPNPFTDQVTIDYSLPQGLERGEMNIYNSPGQLMKSFSIKNNEGMIEFGRNLPAGVYFVQLNLGNFSKTLTIIRHVR